MGGGGLQVESDVFFCFLFFLFLFFLEIHDFRIFGGNYDNFDKYFSGWDFFLAFQIMERIADDDTTCENLINIKIKMLHWLKY